MWLSLQLMLLSLPPSANYAGVFFIPVILFLSKECIVAKDLACLEIQSGSKWVHIILYLGSIGRKVSIKANPFKYQSGSCGSGNWRFKHLISVH
jgi:hypothetical protein